MKKLIIYSDGGARGNPGPAGIGAVIYNENKEIIAKISNYIGEKTNNMAEYEAIIAGLDKAVKFNPKEVVCFLDSELIVKQVNGEYRVKDEKLKPLFLKLQNLIKKFNAVSFTHIKREKNKDADKLVNIAIDKGI